MLWELLVMSVGVWFGKGCLEVFIVSGVGFWLYVLVLVDEFGYYWCCVVMVVCVVYFGVWLVFVCMGVDVEMC